MSTIGAFFENNLIVVVPIMGVLAAILFFWIITLEMRFKSSKKQHTRYFADSKVKNLEELILKNCETIKILDKDIQELFNISNQINSLAAKGMHKVGLIRFNPFKDVGGDQSFALAVLNGKNNGFTLSSLYTKEGARVFAKAITGGVAEKHPLTEEEEEAIRIALGDKNAKAQIANDE